MAPNDIALPDAQLHLKKLASPLTGLEENVEFELRMISSTKNGSPVSQRFNPLNKSSTDNALKQALRYNDNGYNIYTTVNPIKAGGHPLSACKDVDVVAATFLFLDADEAGIANTVIATTKLPYDFVVVTGTKPHLRIHLYCRLESPHSDLDGWRCLMDKVIQAHSCDPAAKNLSRLMRLAGFVSYPSETKSRREYETELVQFYDKDDYFDFL